MALIVADSDVLIDFLRGISPGAERVSLALDNDDVATTTVSAFELLTGARGADEVERIEALLDSLLLFDLDLAAAREAALIKKDLMVGGLPLATGDILIAGITMHRGGRLLTRNLRHFDRVPGLPLETV